MAESIDNKLNSVKDKDKDVIVVDAGSIISVLNNGVSIRITPQFIKKYLKCPEISDEELMEVLKSKTDEVLCEIFAAGVYDNQLKIFEKLDESKKENPVDEKSDEEKKRYWIPIILTTIPFGMLLTQCGTTIDDNPPAIIDVVEEEVGSGESIEKMVPQKRDFTLTLYMADDSTKSEKFNTDFGNQESASNDRKEGKTSDGEEEWFKEKNSLSRYNENQEAIQIIEECREILLSDTASRQEKIEALHRMKKPYQTIRDSYDSEKMEQITQDAIAQSEKNPDEITSQEVNLAQSVQEDYEKQKECQDSNVILFMYLDYLELNGYRLTNIEVSVNKRGDMELKFSAVRLIYESKENAGEKSFEEFVDALNEYEESGRKREHFLEDLVFEEADEIKANQQSRQFGDEDYQAMTKQRNPKAAQWTTLDLLEAVEKLDKDSVTIDKNGMTATIITTDKEDETSRE